MPERTLDDPLLWEKLTAWLTDRPELLVDVYYPHSGGGSDLFFVFGLTGFRQLVDDAIETCGKPRHLDGAVITVIYPQQYPFRGQVDDEFIQKAVDHFQDVTDLDISEGKAYPARARFESVDDATQLGQILRDQCFGRVVWIGPDPADVVPNLFSENKLWSENDRLVIRIPAAKP